MPHIGVLTMQVVVFAIVLGLIALCLALIV